MTISQEKKLIIRLQNSLKIRSEIWRRSLSRNPKAECKELYWENYLRKACHYTWTQQLFQRKQI